MPGLEIKKKKSPRGFPGGSVVKNLPANAGETGLIPDLGRSHMPRSNEAHEPQLLSLAQEPGSCNEKPPQWEASTLQLESRPHLPNLEKSPCSNKDTAQPKINNKK